MMEGRLLTHRELRSLSTAFLEAMDNLARSGYPIGIEAHVDALGRITFSTYKLVDGPRPDSIVVDNLCDLFRFGRNWEPVSGSYITREQVRNMAAFLIECGTASVIEDLLAQALGGGAA